MAYYNRNHYNILSIIFNVTPLIRQLKDTKQRILLLIYVYVKCSRCLFSESLCKQVKSDTNHI